MQRDKNLLGVPGSYARGRTVCSCVLGVYEMPMVVVAGVAHRFGNVRKTFL